MAVALAQHRAEDFAVRDAVEPLAGLLTLPFGRVALLEPAFPWAPSCLPFELLATP